VQLPRERPRVLHVITRMILGGAQEDALLALDGLARSGDWEVGLVTGPETGPEGTLLPRARRLGIPVRVVGPMRREVRPALDIAAAAELRRLFSELRPDVVQTHSSKAGILGRWAARRAAVPVVIHRVHGVAFGPHASPWRNALYVALERAAARRADRLVVVADAMRLACLEAGIGRPEQFVTIRTGVDVRPYLAADERLRERTRRELGIASGEIVFVKLARLAPLKGHEYVLRAARELEGELPGARLLFVGDGALRPRLEALARELLPPGRCIFTGLVEPERVPALLAASDVLVHASLREGLPRSLVQAGLAARPAVAFSVDGAPEVIENSRSGFLVPPGDVRALAERMLELGRDPALRGSFGSRGRERCASLFGAEALVRATAGLYRELLEEKRRARG